MRSLVTQEQRAQLLANGAQFNRNEDFDPPPVVKLFTPDAGAAWLLAPLDPDFPDPGLALADLGVGCPEMGSVSFSEIEAARGDFRIRNDPGDQAEIKSALLGQILAPRQQLEGGVPLWETQRMGGDS